MDKRIYAIAALMLVAVWASAQDINQQVSVSNDYENRIPDPLKMTPEMTVPDSLKSFNLNFDYSVFNHPYSGTYEFNPYGIDLVPEAMGNRSGMLYLDAAAGFRFAPEAHAVYNPVRKSNASVSLFADVDGYSGKYKTGYTGYDYSEKVGIVSSFSGKKFSLRSGVGFDAMQISDCNATTDLRSENSVSSLYAFARISSRADMDVVMKYDYQLDFKRFQDSFIDENSFRLGVRMEPRIDGNATMRIDAALRYVYMGGTTNSQYASMILHPSVEYPVWKLKLRGGLYIGSAGKLTIYPDLNLQMDLLREYLFVYASLSGKDNLYSYSDMMALNHHLYDVSSLRYTRLRYDARAGIRGGVHSVFGYDVSFGRLSYKDVPMYGYASRLVYASYEALNFRASATLCSKFVDASFDLNSYNVIEGLSKDVYGLPSFKIDGQLLGKFSDRISACLYAHFISQRSAAFDVGTLTVPSMCNLGLRVDYAFSSRVGFWARLDNILDDALRQVPDYASKGFNFLLGVSVNL